MSDFVQPRKTAAHQAPLSTGFSRQEYWSGLPFPSPIYLSICVCGCVCVVCVCVCVCVCVYRPQLDSCVGKIPWRMDRLPTPIFLGFPCDSASKESTCNAGNLGSISGLGRSPGEGKGYSLQYSDLENSMDCRVHGVANSWTRLRDFHFTKFSEFNCHGWLTQCPF